MRGSLIGGGFWRWERQELDLVEEGLGEKEKEDEEDEQSKEENEPRRRTHEAKHPAFMYSYQTTSKESAICRG